MDDYVARESTRNDGTRGKTRIVIIKLYNIMVKEQSEPNKSAGSIKLAK